MVVDLLILVGLGFFLKIFFDGAKNLLNHTSEYKISKKQFYVHGLLGIIFIVVAKLIVSI